jgi:hypothetical protein
MSNSIVKATTTASNKGTVSCSEGDNSPNHYIKFLFATLYKVNMIVLGF